MNIKLPFVTLVLAILSVTAYARVGETTEQCRARYGEPISSSEKGTLYKKSGLLIVATFYEGKCDLIGYRKVEENSLGKAIKLTENEINLLLKSNSQSEWKKQNNLSMSSQWQTEDGTLFANYDIFENTLGVMSAEYLARQKAEREAKEKDSLKGF